MLDKETRRLIKENVKRIKDERAAYKRMLGEKLDYRFIEYMIQKVDADPSLVVKISLTTGDEVIIRREKIEEDGRIISFNGDPNPVDVR